MVMLSGTERETARSWISGMAPLSGVIYALTRKMEVSGRASLLVVPGQREAEEALHCARTFIGIEKVSSFANYELNPYEEASPDPVIAAARISALSKILDGKAELVISTGESTLSCTAPPAVIKESTRLVERDGKLDREEFIQWLVSVGYQRLPEVADPGDFSVRGGVVDLFSTVEDLPVRIELDGDMVESIRFFDTKSQRTLYEGEGVRVFPASEAICKEDISPSPDHRTNEKLMDFIERGVRFPGVEQFLPWIYGASHTLLDYFEGEPEIIFYNPGEIRKRQDFLVGLAGKIYRSSDSSLPPPESLFPGSLEKTEGSGSYSYGRVESSPGSEAKWELFGIEIDSPVKPWQIKRPHLGMAGLIDLVDKARDAGHTLFIGAPSPYRLEVLRKILEREDIDSAMIEPGEVWDLSARGGTYLGITGTRSGFISDNRSLSLITDGDIFGRKIKYRDEVPLSGKTPEIKALSLKDNAYVVHEEYGVGIFRGLNRMEVGDYITDFLKIEYDSGDLLYLPVYRMDKLQKFVGGEGKKPALNRLGGGRWLQAKKRAKERLEKVAAELITIYAAREASTGFSCEAPDGIFEEFSAKFEYEETPDQERAIAEVIEDMMKSRPMDRLICGDVGYGKTEVALRASFLTVMSGKQSAILCPTTVLAQQHYQTFKERFDKFPVRVEVLSRFVPGNRQRRILEDLRCGKVDIIIGTHRLLQGDVEFYDLGLLVIDEEQRFGVTHKERMKKFRSTVDVLTLTATPIPRTLHIAMCGTKDISIISTPPKDRLSIKTFVEKFSEELIRDAVARELRRGGQVYYIHNRIESIKKVGSMLEGLFPGVNMAVAHGKMDDSELKSVMKGFYGGEVQILLSTAIVESGLDVSRANTMIIDRAHTFGLAQLYQLRGRIGRDRRRAYAYLLVPPGVNLGQEATARLSAIEELTELGSGFQIASYDLDIRGAGEILGAHQSGHMQTIGYEMYVRMLEEAVMELKGGGKERWVMPDVELNISAYIPEDYIQDPSLKLDFYRKIAMIRRSDEYEELLMELADRYGEIPSPLLNLLNIAVVKSALAEDGVRELKAGRGKVFISFNRDSGIDRGRLVNLVAGGNGKYGFDRRGMFYVLHDFDDSSWDALSFELNRIVGREAVSF